MWISFRVHLLSLSLSLFFWSVFFPFTLMESFWRRVSCPTDRHAHRHMCFSVLSFGEEKHDSRLHLNVVIMWIYKAFSHDSCHDFSEPLNTSILCLFDLDMKSASGIITEVQFYVYIYIYIAWQYQPLKVNLLIQDEILHANQTDFHSTLLWLFLRLFKMKYFTD